MQCVIKNCGLLWTARTTPSRWLMGAEALSAQGFRTNPEHVHPHGDVQSAFDLPRNDRESRVVRQQAGNAMHVACAGIALLHTFLNVTFPKATAAGEAKVSQAVASLDRFGGNGFLASLLSLTSPDLRVGHNMLEDSETHSHSD